jgi:hypothetical protein
MKFVLAQTHRYWWPVKVLIPDNANPGKFIEQVLKVQFEPMDRDAAIKQQEEYLALTTPSERSLHEHDQLRASCKNWDEVEGEDGSPVPFTDETFDAALKQSWFRIGCYRALNESLNGQEFRLGN